MISIETINRVLDYEIISVLDHVLKVYMVIEIVLIVVFAKLLLFLLRKGIFAKKKNGNVAEGTLHALHQIVSYIIWLIAITLILKVLGIEATVLLGGSAALLVALGLGLQHVFNDFVSGLILLSEGTIKVGDVLEIDGDVIMVKSIGLRSTKGLNRDEIVVIVPNSFITTNKVVNWSHDSQVTRFKINVGVAYGSNVDLVRKVLGDAVKSHAEVLKKDQTEVRFIDFGNSSLDFQVMFYSANIFKIERVKSEIRHIICNNFKANGIEIPFPQMDLHVVSDATKSN